MTWRVANKKQKLESELELSVKRNISRFQTLLRAIILSLLSFISFYPSLSGDFVFDDSEAIVNNRDVQPLLSSWTNVFFNDFWGNSIISKNSHKSYRPLTTLTFRLNTILSGSLNPYSFHLTNVILHIIVSNIVYYMYFRVLEFCYAGHKISRDLKSIPFAAAVLFASHPVHTENVSGVVGRADILSALYFIIALLFFMNSCKYSLNQISLCQFIRYSTPFILGCVVCITLSTLSKELGFTVVGICFAYDVVVANKLSDIFYWRKNNISERNMCKDKLMGIFLRQCSMLTCGIIILALRWWIMGSSPPVFQEVDNPASFVANFWKRVLNYNYIYALNVWLLIHPVWLCFDWSMGCVPLIHSFWDPRLFSVILLWIFLFFIFVKVLMFSHLPEQRLIFISIVFLIVPFLPASNLFMTVGFVIAERILYIPSIGYCLLLAVGFNKLKCSSKYLFLVKVTQLLLVILITGFSLRSMQRSKDWQTERQLFLSAVEICPMNAKVHYNIAKIAADSGDVGLAIKKYQEALSLHPDYDQAMNNLANLLKDAGQLNEAKILLLSAVKIRPTFAAAWMNLGIVEASLGRYSEAEQNYLTALNFRKIYPDCLYNLGNLYLELKQYEKAFEAWKNATLLKPSHAVSWNNMIILMDNMGNLEKAEAIGYQAIEELPKEASIYFNLANVLGKQNKFESAVQNFLIAIDLNKHNSAYYANLGVLYHRWKKYDLAQRAYLQALKLNLGNKSAKDNLELLKRQMPNKIT